MSEVIRAVLSNAQHPEYGQVSMPFPIPTGEYDEAIEVLQEKDVGYSVNRDCIVDEVESAYDVLNALKGTLVNVDELDYLAKRLDSFCTGEDIQFVAMAHKLALADIKDFINLTFCCQQATVIADFSDLEQIGKGHALTVGGGSMSVEMLETLDHHAVALDLIQRGVGAVTPYGVVYDNGMKLEQVYDGRHFPEYYYQDSLMTVEIKSGPKGEATGYLYLPCPDKQIQRTLARAGIGPQGFQMKIILDELPTQVSAVVSAARDGLDDLNKLCRAIEPLDTAQREKLEATVLLAQPTYASEVRQLAENLDQFAFMPKPFDPEADCAITELGYVAYHGSLTLEELMTDDPAEQYRQEMGGLA